MTIERMANHTTNCPRNRIKQGCIGRAKWPLDDSRISRACRFSHQALAIKARMNNHPPAMTPYKSKSPKIGRMSCNISLSDRRSLVRDCGKPPKHTTHATLNSFSQYVESVGQAQMAGEADFHPAPGEHLYTSPLKAASGLAIQGKSLILESRGLTRSVGFQSGRCIWCRNAWQHKPGVRPVRQLFEVACRTPYIACSSFLTSSLINSVVRCLAR